MSIQSLPWAIQSCRASLFTQEMVESVDAVFEAVAGQPPETSTVHRQTGQAIASGPWKFGVLEVSTFPGRVDFAYGPQVATAPTIVLLDGSPIERIQEVIDAANSWINSKNYKINRVAIGSRNFQSCNSVHEAYERFSSYVQVVKVEYPRIQEVLFRLNQPTKFKLLPGLGLNRITTWNVATFHVGAFGVGQLPISLKESHYLMNEIDFNSSADSVDLIAGGAIYELFGEILKEIEVMLKGGVQ